MPQSTVQICIEEQRAHYYKALSTKISEFKRYIAEAIQQPAKEDASLADIENLLIEAISLRNMFDIKPAVVTLTRDDLNLLNRIFNTSA